MVVHADLISIFCSSIRETTMQQKELNKPILVAAWPGMGHVAVSACYYLIAKLKMEFRAEYAATELYEPDHVVIESGLVQPFRYPKSQVFAWRNPSGGRDLMVFIGEAQPPTGRYDYCRKLIDYAQREGAESIFTFAAMATPAELGEKPRVVGAATDETCRNLMVDHQVSLLDSGSISGMNGVLLGVAAERRIPGGCLLGELPVSCVHVPYPRSSLAVLSTFTEMLGIEVDLAELTHEAKRVEAHLSQIVDQIKKVSEESNESVVDEFEAYQPEPEHDPLSEADRDQIETLFFAAEQDRSKAFELKQELDRLEVFHEYEDRFLDLFKDPNSDDHGHS